MELLIPNPAQLRSTPHLFFPSIKTTASADAIGFKILHFRTSSTSFPRLTTRPPNAAAISADQSPPVPPPPPAAPAYAGWIVVMKEPPNAELSSKAEIIDYYVQTLASVLPSEREAQMCIYHASWQKDFFFCCDIDEGSSRELARMPGVMSVRPDRNLEIVEDDTSSNHSLAPLSSFETRSSRFRSSGQNCDYWLVKMEKPGVEVVSKAQMVDYFAQTLTKVMGNEKDAQVCVYNISWEEDFGFCCQIDEECARELSDVPGVLSVEPDVNFESENKNYKADDTSLKTNDSPETSSPPSVKTKRLFVTGLSFYTSEKTLRANFEPFGELVEVKIIMDKISKRSKGYAFIEYTTEEAAGAALKEMNGKIINGWMIVVDVAKTNPPKYNKGRPRQTFRSSSSPYTSI